MTDAADRHYPSTDELAKIFRAKVASALHFNDRELPVDNRIPISELVAMFEASTKKGRCPTAEDLSAFPLLQGTWWARRMVEVQQELAQRSSEAEEALLALGKIESFLLPRVIADKLTMQMPGFSDEDRDLLRAVFEVIPRIAAVIAKTPRGSTVAAWHRPAEMVACEAIAAWRLAGRSVIGIDDDSPLTGFTEAWLARAGVHHASRAAIAKVFFEGCVRACAKSPTRMRPKK